MKVEILSVIDGQLIGAKIAPPSGMLLPSIVDGWRFNFNKHSKKKGYQTFVLTCDATPDRVEGCLVFEMKSKIEPYMCFIEIAPHNIGYKKQYDKIPGCLIAYACRLSFIHGKGDYQGWLSFDVMEKDKKDELKLMSIYCMKYGAMKFGETTMVISPEAGEQLINKFLK